MKKIAMGLVWAAVTLASAADLPEGYRALEYVRSTGTAFVDTGYYIGPNTRIEMEFEVDPNASGAILPFGSAGTAAPHFFLYHSGSSWLVQIGSSPLTSWLDNPPARTGRLTLVVDAAAGMATLGGSTVSVPYGSSDTAGQTAYIFARHDANGSAMLPTPMKLYSFKIYEDGRLVREYVPAVKRDTRTYGLYETQTGGFLTHADLQFSAGLVEVASTNPEYGEPVPACGISDGYTTGSSYVFYSPRRWIDIGGRDTATCTGWRFTRLDGTVEEGTGCVMTLAFDAAHDGGRLEWVWTRNHLDVLPEGYVAMPRLAGTGTQYVDTGVELDSTMWVDMQCAFPHAFNKSNGWVPFGTESPDASEYYFCYMQTGMKWSAYLGSGTSLNIPNADPTSYVGRHRVQINRDRRLIVDGVSSGTIGTVYSTTNTAYVFARHDCSSGDRPNYFTPMDLYSLDIYGPQGPIRMFVPALKTADGALGLYDLVTQTFTPGVGDFGLATFVRIREPSGTIDMLTVTGGTGVNLSAPPAPSADGVHRVCTGWRFTRVDGSVKTGSGDSLNIVFTDADNGGLLEWNYREAGEPELPDGYVRLDHVSSDGSGQYIDTGIIPDSRTSIRARFRNYPKSGYTIPFGLAFSEGKYCFLFPDNTANVSWTFYWKGSRYSWSAGYPDSYGLHEVLFNFYDGLIALDGFYQGAKISDDGFVAEDTMYLFARHETKGQTFPAAMDLYSFMITTNGVLAREFVPAHAIAERTAGLYETVEGRFYPNEGEGVFEPAGGFIEVDGEKVFGRAVGETYTYTAPSSPTSQTALARRRCVGWRYTRRNGTTSEGTGNRATLAFTAEDDAGRLEWIWSEASRGDEFRRCALTFAADAIMGACPLTNFPVLVRLSAERVDGFAYDQCAPDGADIRFSLSPTGDDLLACEIDTWNPQGESLIWVKIPELVRGMTFYMFWGDGKTQRRLPAEMWSDYIGVWHFNALENDAFASSAPNGPLLALRGEGMLSVDSETARIGSAKAGTAAVHIEDYQSVVAAAREDGRSDVFSVSGWFRVPRQMIKNLGIGFYYPYSAYGQGQTGWYVELTDRQEYFTYGTVRSDKTKTYNYSNIVNMDEDWAHIAISAEQGRAYVSVNGVRIPGYSYSVALTAAEGMELYLPYGWLDEVRMSRQVLSEDWMRCEYRQVVDRTFLTADAAVSFEEAQRSTLVLIR